MSATQRHTWSWTRSYKEDRTGESFVRCFVRKCSDQKVNNSRLSLDCLDHPKLMRNGLNALLRCGLKFGRLFFFLGTVLVRKMFPVKYWKVVKFGKKMVKLKLGKEEWDLPPLSCKQSWQSLQRTLRCRLITQHLCSYLFPCHVSNLEKVMANRFSVT